MPKTESEPYQERQIAVKIKIKEIEEGNYLIEEGWTPNYLLTKKGAKVSRVNLMGVILDKEKNGAMNNLILDDGSGKITIRSFEEIKNLDQINPGEGVLVIGKIREYNQKKYISPEIIKKINPQWLKLRSLELKEEQEKTTISEEPVVADEFPDLANQKIIELIKELDQGDGALIEEVKEKSTVNRTESLIESMLETGEIFQNLPGRVKVL